MLNHGLLPPNERQSSSHATFFKCIGGGAGALTGAAIPVLIAFIKSGTNLFSDTISDTEFNTFILPISIPLLGFIGGYIGYARAISSTGREEDPSLVTEFINHGYSAYRYMTG